MAVVLTIIVTICCTLTLYVCAVYVPDPKDVVVTAGDQHLAHAGMELGAVHERRVGQHLQTLLGVNVPHSTKTWHKTVIIPRKYICNPDLEAQTLC